jgi:hypothetical protein
VNTGYDGQGHEDEERDKAEHDNRPDRAVRRAGWPASPEPAGVFVAVVDPARYGRVGQVRRIVLSMMVPVVLSPGKAPVVPAGIPSGKTPVMPAAEANAAAAIMHAEAPPVAAVA